MYHQDWNQSKSYPNLDEEYEITKPNGCVIVIAKQKKILSQLQKLYILIQKLNKIKNASKIVIKHYITFKSYSEHFS